MDVHNESGGGENDVDLQNVSTPRHHLSARDFAQLQRNGPVLVQGLVDSYWTWAQGDDEGIVQI